jgi:hypothetical protein
MYVPHNAMAAGKKLDKWSERTRVGVYLGKSSQHARTVALVLSLTTGLTSPQFTSNLIQTMRKSFHDQPVPSFWQTKCGFKIHKGKPGSSVVPPEGAAPAATPPDGTSDADPFQESTHVRFPDEATPMQPSEGAME